MGTPPRIKVCGLTRSQDAQLAVSLGAWALGFIFYPASPRATSVENAGKIILELGGSDVRRVGVFVNASRESIVEAVKSAGLSAVQLHGEESPQFCASLRGDLSEVDVIKALRPRRHEDLTLVATYLASCESVLLDTYVAGEPGGTGIAGDWGFAAEAAKLGRVILAGGLQPSNIRLAVRTPGVFAFDASSGLESAPGIKSEEKMTKFFKNAREQAS